MSVEGPEARILAEQMHHRLAGHRIVGCDVHDVAGLQPSGFVNRDLSDFERLVGATIEAVESSGNTIRIALDNETNLVIGAEYGGRVLLHAGRRQLPDKTHLVLDFDDGFALSVRLTGMGVLRCDTDAELESDYVYQRDFSDTPDPTRRALTFEVFDQLVVTRSHALKSVLVGKNAAVVGISNSAFQDILYRAGLHPKRKASELTPAERRRLHEAVQIVMGERQRLGGKQGFIDLYGMPGVYQPAMGPDRKNTACEECGTMIEAVSVGGGRVYLCPACQR